MSFNLSVLDQLSDALSLSMRKIQDIKTDLTGQKVSLLRITSSDYSSLDDELGDFSLALDSSIVDNVVIQYPLNEVEIASNLNKSTGKFDQSAIDMWEILPIRLFVIHEGTFANEITKLKEKDILIHVLIDENGNKNQIRLKIEKSLGQFFGKNLIRRSYQASLERGTLEDDIEQIINNYVESFGVPTVSGTIPSNGATGVSVDSTITVGFNIPVNTTLAETSGVIFSPEINSPSYTWNADSSQVEISGAVNLTSGQIYSGTVNSDYIKSTFGLYLAEDYNFEFTTI
jgi:hypothetical protein